MYTTCDIYFKCSGCRNVGTKEINQVKNAPLVVPRQQTIRTVHSLQAILVLIAPKLIVVSKTPRQGPNDVDAVLMYALQRLSQEVKVVQRALQVLPLVPEGARVLAVDGVPELGDHDPPRGAERVPHVPQLLAHVLRRDVRVGVGPRAHGPAVELGVGQRRAGREERVRRVGRAGCDPARGGAGELGDVGVDGVEVARAVYVCDLVVR